MASQNSCEYEYISFDNTPWVNQTHYTRNCIMLWLSRSYCIIITSTTLPTTITASLVTTTDYPLYLLPIVYHSIILFPRHSAQQLSLSFLPKKMSYKTYDICFMLETLYACTKKKHDFCIGDVCTTSVNAYYFERTNRENRVVMNVH